MSKCQLKVAQFLHLACQVGRLAPLSPFSYAADEGAWFPTKIFWASLQMELGR